MYDKLTKSDIQKLQEEIDYRKLLSAKMRSRQSKRHGNTAISVKILNIMRPKRIRTEMKAGFVILSG